MEKRYFVLPKWVTALYIVSAAVLLPWTYYLAKNLPENHLAQHWDMAWAGFDAAMIIVLLITVIFAIRRTIWLAIPATIFATMLVIDAWFDVLTSRPGHPQKDAVLFALFVELPIAVLTYIFVFRTVGHLHRHLQKIKK